MSSLFSYYLNISKIYLKKKINNWIKLQILITKLTNIQLCKSFPSCCSSIVTSSRQSQLCSEPADFPPGRLVPAIILELEDPVSVCSSLHTWSVVDLESVCLSQHTWRIQWMSVSLYTPTVSGARGFSECLAVTTYLSVVDLKDPVNACFSLREHLHLHLTSWHWAGRL